MDGDPASRLLAGALLERAGYRISEADSGEEALAALTDAHDFALTVLDLDMQGMTGPKLLLAIRSMPGTATLPVIVLTGNPDPGADIELMELGADD